MNNVAAPDAEGAAPPKRLWLERREIYGINIWIESTSDDGIEYIEKSAHDTEVARLREVLRGLSRKPPFRDGSLCWCEFDELLHGNDPRFGHWPPCAAARKELEGTK